MNIVGLTREFYNRIALAVTWVERVSRGYRIQSIDASAGPQGINPPTPGNKMFFGQITDVAPDGTTPEVAGTGACVYPVRICSPPINSPSQAPQVPASTSVAHEIVYATNFNEMTFTHSSNNDARCLPGQFVILFQYTDEKGISRYVFTCAPGPCFSGETPWDASDSANYAKSWAYFLEGGTGDSTAPWTYYDNVPPYTHTITLPAGSKDPRYVKGNIFGRFVQGDGSNLPKLKKRVFWWDRVGALFKIDVETDETLGERVTVITDVQLRQSGSDHILEKKTREAIVFWKDTESGWTNAGTVTDNT